MTALYRCNEVEDPGADGHAEREDRGGGRVLGDCGRRRSERDRQPRVQQ